MNLRLFRSIEEGERFSNGIVDSTTTKYLESNKGKVIIVTLKNTETIEGKLRIIDTGIIVTHIKSSTLTKATIEKVHKRWEDIGYVQVLDA